MYHFFRYYSQPIQNGQHARQGVLSILKPDCEAVIHPMSSLSAARRGTGASKRRRVRMRTSHEGGVAVKSNLLPAPYPQKSPLSLALSTKFCYNVFAFHQEKK